MTIAMEAHASTPIDSQDKNMEVVDLEDSKNVIGKVVDLEDPKTLDNFLKTSGRGTPSDPKKASVLGKGKPKKRLVSKPKLDKRASSVEDKRSVKSIGSLLKRSESCPVEPLAETSVLGTNKGRDPLAVLDSHEGNKGEHEKGNTEPPLQEKKTPQAGEQDLLIEDKRLHPSLFFDDLSYTEKDRKRAASWDFVRDSRTVNQAPRAESCPLGIRRLRSLSEGHPESHTAHIVNEEELPRNGQASSYTMAGEIEHEILRKMLQEAVKKWFPQCQHCPIFVQNFAKSFQPKHHIVLCGSCLSNPLLCPLEGSAHRNARETSSISSHWIRLELWTKELPQWTFRRERLSHCPCFPHFSV